MVTVVRRIESPSPRTFAPHYVSALTILLLCGIAGPTPVAGEARSEPRQGAPDVRQSAQGGVHRGIGPTRDAAQPPPGVVAPHPVVAEPPTPRTAAPPPIAATPAPPPVAATPAPPPAAPVPGKSDLVMLVMDPLALQNAGPCVAGYGQRDYLALARYLAGRLRRTVIIKFSSVMSQAVRALSRPPDIIVAKQSVAESYIDESHASFRRVAMLTGRDGKITQRGVFIVRAGDQAHKLHDLDGRLILFGTPDEEERSAAAVAALRQARAAPTGVLETRPDCDLTARALVDREADAGVISSYAIPLVTGCGVVKPGAFRIVGMTAPVPFVAVYVSARISANLRRSLLLALFSVRTNRGLLRKLETRNGFVPARPVRPTEIRRPISPPVSSEIR